MMYVKQIAIDGPAGSGKSTVGTQLATELGYVFVDAGIFYRAITSEILRLNTIIEDEALISEAIDTLTIGMHVKHNQLELRINQRTISENLHSQEINRAVAIVAAYPAVRAAVRHLQAELVRYDGIIIAGRDIGTVVMPHADLKLYLDASLEERASRRYKALLPNNPQLTFQQVLEDLRRRDYHDTHRTNSPLRAAEDAIIINTNGMNVSEVLEVVMSYVRPSPVSS